LAPRHSNVSSLEIHPIGKLSGPRAALRQALLGDRDE